MTRGVLISDFNIDPLARYLRNCSDLDVSAMPYNQVHHALESFEAEVAVIWARAESVLSSFAEALNFADVDHDTCLEEVEAFADLLVRASTRCRHLFVASWALPPDRRGYGLLDWKHNVGLAGLVARMNTRLAECLGGQSNAYVLDSGRWLASVTQPSAAKMWFAAKVPYANGVFQAAAADIAAALMALAGKSRRLILVDLDNTIWGGVIGETGWQGIRLGGHDHIGEAFGAFQRALKSLTKRGIQIAVVSKNDEAVALDAFRHHPEMTLKLNDLAGWRINWNDKAANVAALVEVLQLGLASAVFIDDNPQERELVRKAFPEILVPDWPQDPCLYAETLLALDCFDTAVLSVEDRGRTAMYVAERGRRESRTQILSLAHWLETLGTTVTIQPLRPDLLARVSQLFNKTNQLNLSTRRLTESELIAWAEIPGNSLLTISVSDKFGDMGLCGIIGVSVTSDESQIIDFVLSCRVMGRGVEETMFYLAAVESIRMGAHRMIARYIPTERNRPTLDVLQKCGLKEEAPWVFGWDLTSSYEKPAYVTLICGFAADV